MTPKHSLALAATLLTAGVASAQSFTEVPGGFSCTDVTPDGTIVCGSGGSGGYYWEWQNAATPLPTFFGGNDAVAISDDGSYLAGNMDDPMSGVSRAARYDVGAGTWMLLPTPPLGGGGCGETTAYDISGDGTQIVGLLWIGCDAFGFLWEEGVGTQMLVDTTGNAGNRASTIARDGSLMGGFAQENCRTASSWTSQAVGHAYDITSCSEIFGISDTGARVVGIWNGEGFYTDDDGGTINTFGTMIPGYGANATDTNEALTRIVGFDSQLLDRIAWVWEPGSGFTNLFQALTNAGVPNLPPFGLSVVNSCDASGEILTGFTQFGGAWIVEFPLCDGGTMNRCQTSPNSVDATGAFMSTSGSLSISANDLVLMSSPVPNQNGLHYYGSDLLNGDTGAPFGNGWRCVGPAPVFRLPISLASGNVLTTAVDFTQPPASNIQPGDTIFVQGWYRDPAAGGEAFNFSDAMEITVCD